MHTLSIEIILEESEFVRQIGCCPETFGPSIPAGSFRFVSISGAHAIFSREVHTILTPVAPVLHKYKLLLEQRVIWMGYLKTLRRIVLRMSS